MAPTKTATRFGGRVDAMREFEDWTEERVTIVIPAVNKVIVLLVEDVSVY